MNKLPIMPIRAKYADKSISGKDLDSAVIADVDGKVSVTSITAEEIKGGAITGSSIIEDMSGYSYETASPAGTTLTYNYIGAVKNGNKLTIVIDGKLVPTGDTPYNPNLGWFKMPPAIIEKLVPTDGVVAFGTIGFYQSVGSSAPKQVGSQYYKSGTDSILIQLMSVNPNAGILTSGVDYRFRIEQTFLLSENLVP